MLRKVSIISVLCLWLPLMSVAAEFEAGEQYIVLPEELYNRNMMVTREDEVEVVEFFSYGCPFCHQLEPVVDEWLKTTPDGMVYRRIPVTFFPSWEEYARAYYVTEILGNTDELHPALFEAVLIERRPLGNKEEVEAFFIDQGVDAVDFNRAYTGVMLGPKVQQGQNLFQYYRLTSTPAAVINGKYRTDVAMAGGEKEFTEVITFLVEKELAENNN